MFILLDWSLELLTRPFWYSSVMSRQLIVANFSFYMACSSNVPYGALGWSHIFGAKVPCK
jgi:hypothetical protein